MGTESPQPSVRRSSPPQRPRGSRPVNGRAVEPLPLGSPRSARRPPPLSLGQRLGVLLVLGLAGSSAIATAQVGYQLVVNPQSVQWVSRWIPGWQVRPTAEPDTLTLSAIRSEIRRQGKTFGEWMPLGDNTSVMDGKSPTQDFLLPVSQSHIPCFHDCDRLVELRVYQRVPSDSPRLAPEPRYLLLQTLAVPGVEESQAIAPLTHAQSPNQGSSKPLPVTQLRRYEGTVPKLGVWLSVSGERRRGDEAIAYGHLVYYHPRHQHLSIKLTWTSPTATLPFWKQVTGDATPELLIDQTIGMEPAVEMYQVQPLVFVYSPVQLEPIALNTPVLTDASYRSALVLARGRLWSTSSMAMQAVKTRSPQTWNATTQAQTDLIQWHAQATATQADAAWSSAGQQVLANLLDGRWEQATQVFESSLEASQETVPILKADRDRLWQRVNATLQVNPKRVDAKVWGALLLAVQKHPNAAIAWVQARPHTTKPEVQRIRALLQRLDPNFTAIVPAPIVPAPEPAPIAAPSSTPAASAPNSPPDSSVAAPDQN